MLNAELKDKNGPYADAQRRLRSALIELDEGLVQIKRIQLSRHRLAKQIETFREDIRDLIEEAQGGQPEGSVEGWGLFRGGKWMGLAFEIEEDARSAAGQHLSNPCDVVPVYVTPIPLPSAADVYGILTRDPTAEDTDPHGGRKDG